jgi:hypothetical protein
MDTRFMEGYDSYVDGIIPDLVNPVTASDPRRASDKNLAAFKLCFNKGDFPDAEIGPYQLLSDWAKVMIAFLEKGRESRKETAHGTDSGPGKEKPSG